MRAYSAIRKIGAAFAWPFTIKAKNDAALARLVAEGKLHPDDVQVLRLACRAGKSLYQHSDGRLRFVRRKQ